MEKIESVVVSFGKMVDGEWMESSKTFKGDRCLEDAMEYMTLTKKWKFTVKIFRSKTA